MKKNPWPSATRKAVAAISIWALIQVILLIYSFSHPSVERFVASSFGLTIAFYLIVWNYHDRRMKNAEK